MTSEEYRKHPGINQSALKVLGESPQLFYERYIAKTLAEREPTPAMKFGTAVENYLRTGSHGFICLPDDIRARRGKEYEAWKATIDPTLQVVTKTEWNELRLNDLEKVKRNVDEHPRASQLISEGDWHKHLFWEYEEIGQCKAELDLVWQNKIIADVKTAADTTPEGFARQALNLGYHIQAAWYTGAYLRCHGAILPFVFIVIKNSEPYNVETYTLSEQFITLASQKIMRLSEEYVRRRDSNDWHTDTHGTIATIEPPKWALSEVSQWSL